MEVSFWDIYSDILNSYCQYDAFNVFRNNKKNNEKNNLIGILDNNIMKISISYFSKADYIDNYFRKLVNV